MEKKLYETLKGAFHAPPPERKAAFLRTHRRRELSSAELLLSQAGYVRWWTWALSAALFVILLLLAAGREPERVWISAALTPLLALIAIAEWGRSRRYGMEELELCCRMPTGAVLLARMASVGLLHLALLAVFTPMLAAKGEAGILRAGIYLLTPYLLTASLGMELSRRIRGQEGLLVCTAAAVLVCVLGVWALGTRRSLYQPEYLPLWQIALVLTLGASAWETVQCVKGTEELQWS